MKLNVRWYAIALLLFMAFPSQDSYAAIPLSRASVTQAGTGIPPGLVPAHNKPFASLAQLPGEPEPEVTASRGGGVGTAALICGLIGLWPAAIVLGIIGMAPGRLNRNRAKAGLILGVVGGAFFLLALTIALL